MSGCRRWGNSMPLHSFQVYLEPLTAPIYQSCHQGETKQKYIATVKVIFPLMCRLSRLMITDIVARWYGSAHDVTIFNSCALRANTAKFETGQIPSGHLLDDNWYGVKPYLLTPLLNPLTEPEKRYNHYHTTTRNTAEREYGIWKHRFPAMKLGMRVDRKNMLAIIVATALLHNTALGASESIPPDEQMLLEQRSSCPTYRISNDIPDNVIIYRTTAAYLHSVHGWQRRQTCGHHWIFNFKLASTEEVRVLLFHDVQWFTTGTWHISAGPLQH